MIFLFRACGFTFPHMRFCQVYLFSGLKHFYNWVRVGLCASMCVMTYSRYSLLADFASCRISCLLCFFLADFALLFFSLCVVLFCYLCNSQTHCLLFVCGPRHLFYLHWITDYIVCYFTWRFTFTRSCGVLRHIVFVDVYRVH